MKGREEPVRLAHLISHPIQYFAPLYRELSRRPEVDLTVYYYSDATTGAHLDVGFGREIAWDADLLGGYRSRFLPSSRDVQPDSGQRRAHLDLLRELASERYDAIWIHGYAHVANWLAAVVAAATRTKVLLRDEQTLLRPRSWRRRIVKRVVLSPLFGTSLCLFIGAQNRRHFEHFGARRLFPTPYCVDNDYFGLAAARLAAGRDAIRSAWGLGGAPVVLFAGKLVDYKQPLQLLDAFHRVASEFPCSLLVAGDGPLASSFDDAAQALGTKRVVRTGFLNQTELPRAYAAADIFVLPSRSEPWGLVVNEAMNFGLPVVVSDGVGCAEDLVEHGANGFVFAHDDTESLAEALRILVRDGDLRASFGARSRQVVKRYNIARCASGIVEACLAGCSVSEHMR